MLHIGGYIHKEDGTLMVSIEFFEMITIELDETQATTMAAALNKCVEAGKKLDGYKPCSTKGVGLMQFYDGNGNTIDATTLTSEG